MLAISTPATHSRRNPMNTVGISSTISVDSLGAIVLDAAAKAVRTREIKIINTKMEPTKRLSKKNNATIPHSTPSYVSSSSGILRFEVGNVNRDLVVDTTLSTMGAKRVANT